MHYPFIIGIYGHSNTGKTTLITALINKFNDDGFQVATIKRSTKPFSFDTKHTDTWRHKHAGAQTVLFSSPHNTVLLTTQSIDELQNLELLTHVGNIDIILIEGSHHPIIPKIRIGSIQERENTCLTITEGNIDKTYEFIKKHMTSHHKQQKISLQVNDKNIDLSDFPEEIILKTMLGMISSLHSVDEIESFNITYRK